MAVEFDFSDVDPAFAEFEAQVVAKISEVGEEAVQYAKEHGDYQDQTGTLRRSNEYEADITGLTLRNDTEYASYVESREFDVLSGGALFAEKRLREEFE